MSENVRLNKQKWLDFQLLNIRSRRAFAVSCDDAAAVAVGATKHCEAGWGHLGGEWEEGHGRRHVGGVGQHHALQ